MEAETLIQHSIKSAFGDFLATVGGVDVAASLSKAAYMEILCKKSLLTPEEVATLYGIPASTLATWRSRGKGPDYTKLEGSIFYTTSQIEKWIAANEVKVRR